MKRKYWLKQVLADAKVEREGWPDWAKHCSPFLKVERLEAQINESSSDWNWRENMPDQYK